MTQELEQRRDLTPAQRIVQTIRSERFQGEIALVLPDTVTPQKFARTAITALQASPEIVKCDGESILRALVLCAQMGLLPDNREAALVAYGTTATLIPMVGGFRRIAADHGWMLRTQVVYENDRFEHSEEPQSILHVPVRPGAAKGEKIAAYAIATHRDGRRMQRVLDRDEILKRRAMARSKKVWDAWEHQMWEKTPARDIFADLPLGDLTEERTRVARMVAEFDRDPAAAAAALYGPVAGEEPRALDRGTQDSSDERAGSHASLAREAGGSDEQSPGPEEARTPGSLPHADGYEPVYGEVIGDEVVLEQPAAATPSPFRAPAGVGVPEELVDRANAAALLPFPAGRCKGMSLAEVQEADPNSILWLLGNWNSEPMRTEVRHFARVYAPEAYHGALAAQEATA